MPPKPSLSSLDSSQTSALRPVSSAERDGLLGQPARALEVRGHGGQHPGAPAGAPDRDGPAQHRVGGVVGAAVADHDLGGRLLARSVGAPVEAEGAEHGADDEGLEALGTGDAGDRGGHALPVEDVAGERGAGAPQVDRAGVAHPDQEHQREVGVVRAAARHQHARHLAGLAGGLGDLAGAEQVEPRAVARARPRPARGGRPSSPGSTGSATTSTPLRACGSAPLKANWGGDT